MKSLALHFAILWVCVSAIIFGFSTSSYLANTDTFGKEGLFFIFMTLLIMLTGMFFAVNHKKITLYLQNYKREKQI